MGKFNFKIHPSALHYRLFRTHFMDSSTTESPFYFQGFWDKGIHKECRPLAGSLKLAADFRSQDVVVEQIVQQKLSDSWEHEFLTLHPLHPPTNKRLIVVTARDFDRHSTGTAIPPRPADIVCFRSFLSLSMSND